MTQQQATGEHTCAPFICPFNVHISDNNVGVAVVQNERSGGPKIIRNQVL